MDIELSSEDLAFRDEVRAFFDENKMKEGEDYFSWRLGWFKKARKKGGWDVPKWPAKFGGPGWTPTQHYIWEQETARATIPFDLPFGLGMLAPILMSYGSKEQQDRFMPDIRDRKVNWCQGYSEPGAGSDLANLKTKAVLSDDGTYYTVNGSKIWTTLAHVADWIFCLTRTDDSGIKQQGITFLLFPMKQEGIEVKPIITLGGSHTVNTVHFTDVKVPVENRVGEEGKGFDYILDGLNAERLLIASECIGDAKYFIDKSVDYAKNREVFGRPIGKNQAIQFPISKAYARTIAAEYILVDGCKLFDSGKSCGKEANISKMLSAEASWEAAEATMQTFGGFSFSEEYNIERKYRETRLYQIAPVSTNMILAYISHKILGLPRSY